MNKKSRNKTKLIILGLTFTYLPKIGGAELAIHNLCKALANKGCIVLLLVPLQYCSGKLRVIRIQSNFYVLLMPVRGLPLETTFKILEIGLKLGKFINILHAFYIYPSALWGSILKLFIWKPLTATVTGADIQINCELKYGFRLKRYVDILIRTILTFIDRVFIPNKIDSYEVTRLIKGKYKIEIVPWGVDVKVFKPLQIKECHHKYSYYRLKASYVTLLSIGRYDPRKNYETLLKALHLLINTYNCKNVKLVLVIPNLNKASTLLKLAKSLNLKNNIEFKSKLPVNELILLINSADIIVIPSIKEMGPLVALEALSCGIPILGGITGFIPELVYKTRCGLICKNVRDPHSLAQQIMLMIKLLPFLKKKSEYARKVIIREYSWYKVAEKYIIIWEELKRNAN